MSNAKNAEKNNETERLIADIGLLDPKLCEFYNTDGGFTGLKIGEKDYPHIILRRSLPIAAPNAYISVADHENKEIGILRDLEDFSGKQREILETELISRYYAPQVLSVISVKDKLGYVYIEMRVKNMNNKEHVKSAAIKDVSRNIRMLSDKSLIIFDVDGNRYMINNIFELDKHSIKRLDPYLF